MLELKGIKKDYGEGETIVHALKGVSLSFRKAEFVSILGASGCGKTTMLNIIGGLDRYTEGDLLINGRSTKSYRDRDWDIYRNHRVGFIFQSYNLIPHQTVLGNVELALTIAGMGKAERIAKAKAALDKVGLSDQYHKRPNQLSGGQCQRVAIARALVNDPEILLADEPTGALDTVTSVQIMELVREIAKEQLVIMVTHNPELAQKYSSRIIHLSDGELISDSNPYTPSAEDIAEVVERTRQEEEDPENAKKRKRTKMSLFTAFKLSLYNLLTKKRRTIMTSVAGSIGIIGVSLVLAVSYGVQMFINDMQNDMLSGNPIEISESALDLTALMESGDIDYDSIEWQEGKVNVDSTISNLVQRSESMNNIMQSNEISQDYIDYVLSLPPSQVSAIMLGFGLNLDTNLYTEFKTPTIDGGEQAQVMSLAAIKAVYEAILIHAKDYAQYASFISSLSDPFRQLPKERDYILGNADKGVEGQYNLIEVAGVPNKYATEADEVMLVLRKNSWLSDLLLAQLGFYSQDEFMNMVARAVQNTENGNAFAHDPDLDKFHFDYSEIIGHEFIYYPNAVAFEKADTPYTSMTVNLIDESAFHHRPYESMFSSAEKGKGIRLRVSGILEPRDDLSYGTLSAGFFYTEALRDRIFEIEEESQSDIVRHLIENGSFSSTYQVNQKIAGQDERRDILQGVTFQYDYVYPYENPPVSVTTYAAVGASNPFLSLATSFGGAAASATPGFGDAGLEMVMAGLSAKTLSLRDLSGRTVERAALDIDAVLKQIGKDAEAASRLQATLLDDIAVAESALTTAQRALSDAQTNLLEALATTNLPPNDLQMLIMTRIGEYAAAQQGVVLKGAELQTHWDAIDGMIRYELKDYQHIVTAEITKGASTETVTMVFDRVGGLVRVDCNATADAAEFIGIAALYFNAASDAEQSVLTKTPVVASKVIANSIAIYPVDFEQKQLVLEHLDAWNGDGTVTITYADGTTKDVLRSERADITYTDILSLIFAMIGAFIGIVATALICFTALALVVSTVMIAIITYVSVVERIKEIGVIRSLGGRKKDVSHLFNAETLIIGTVSGLIGISFTFLASWIINIIVNIFEPGIGVIAILPWFFAVGMVLVSITLTLISGLVPSMSAANKDPVVALRTE